MMLALGTNIRLVLNKYLILFTLQELIIYLILTAKISIWFATGG